jgi:uncharacterized protein YjbI with pentapeptide repeats
MSAAGLSADVFPYLGRWLALGLVLGMAWGLCLASLTGRSRGVWALDGAVLGSALGLFLGWARAVRRPAEPLPVVPATPTLEVASPAPAEPVLWDPWLDTGQDQGWPHAEPDPPSTLPEATWEPPCIAPRVISPITGETLLLHDAIGELLARDVRGAVAVLGGPGSGRSFALKHLESVLPPEAPVKLADDVLPTTLALMALSVHRLGIGATGERQALPKDLRAIYRLAPWSRDDVIAYLLKAHHSRCASVMARLEKAADESFLGGIPELWTVVLDRMAEDDSIPDVRSALRREVERRLADPELRRRVQRSCLDAVRGGFEVFAGDEAIAVQNLIRHAPAELLLAADWLADALVRQYPPVSLARVLPRELVEETGRVIAGRPEARGVLVRLLSGGDRKYDAMAASLLHAAGVAWRPSNKMCSLLSNAYLPGVRWIGVNLERADLRRADLEGADLWNANMAGSNLAGTRLCRAELREASLADGHAPGADLSGASMTRVRAPGIKLVRARLSHADLRESILRRAIFHDADLSGAILRDANLWKADLEGASIAGADFRGAVLEDARLKGLPLRLARFEGARLGGADLAECDLEGMELPEADFHDANLIGALLTGSTMPRANFVGALLRQAGLADVRWPGAILRDADLSGASFHLGTTRSGLVPGNVPCEGSRTGFYTDEYNERDYKPIEEIRKADLREADLRGADIAGVDFYLVDLRGARYDPDQAEHLAQTGAILS